jgi:S-adenosylmethionine hydrolase
VGPETGSTVPGPGGAAVFFLSDYGTVDEFVGVVHAVLHRLAPAAPVIDLSHQLPHFDIAAGSAMLVRAAPHLGAGVVLAVVDPGVGTTRRAVAVETAASARGGPGWLVGPDNGLLTAMAVVLGGAVRVVRLEAEPSTFDGRDVFAPAAAHLVTGGDPSILGTQVDPASLAAAADPEAGPTVVDGPAGLELVATVAWVDGYGNVQLDAGPDQLDQIGMPAGGTARLWASTSPKEGIPVRRVGAFAQLGADELGVMADANGRVALVVNRGTAAHRMGLAGSGPVTGPVGQRVRMAEARPAPPSGTDLGR